MISRRNLLKGAAALTAAAAAPSFARAADARVPLGFHNAPALGLRSSAMRRLSGTMPKGLSGKLLRNGPAHFRRGSEIIGHWFDGDGFIRAFDISEHGVSLTGQFVETVKRKRETEADAFLMPGFGTKAAPGVAIEGPDATNAANTSLLCVEDRLWALWEGGSPYEIDPESLSGGEPVTLRDDLKGMPFSAHPKVSPDGTIWNFGLSFGRPYAFIWALSAEGAVKKSGLIELPHASYLHDWVVTKTKLILPLQPWISTQHQPPFASALEWMPELGLQVLVIDKDDFSERRIYQLPAGSFFHTGDAYEDADGAIRFDICLSDQPTLGAQEGRAILSGNSRNNAEPHLAMAVLKPNGSADLISTPYTAEFPTIDQRLATSRRSTVFAASTGSKSSHQGFTYNAVMSFCWETGRRDHFDFGANAMAEEPIFVPNGSDRNNGWLVVTVLNTKVRATELHIFNARTLSEGPVCSWRASTPLPLSFHGVWRPHLQA